MKGETEHEVRITLLGTGNAFHDDGFAHQSILVSSASYHFCIDYGATAVVNMINYGFSPSDLDVIFLTHLHGDHIAGLPFLLLRMQRDGRRTRIIGPRGSRERIDQILSLFYPGSGLSEEADFEEVPPGAVGLTVRQGPIFDVVPMVHSEESIGYRVNFRGKTIAVSGDTAWTESLLPLCSEADIAFLECTAVDRLEGHLSVREIHRNIDRLDASTVGFVHTSTQVRDALISWNHPKIRVFKDGDDFSL